MPTLKSVAYRKSPTRRRGGCRHGSPPGACLLLTSILHQPARAEIVKAAVPAYLDYVRQVGRAMLYAQRVGATGGQCSRVVVALFHHTGPVADSVSFESE